MKFKHLLVPDTWPPYLSRYPEGFTIVEALMNWIAQVNNMVDNQNKLNVNVDVFNKRLDEFILQFDKNLQTQVIDTLKEWQESGFLDVVISEALNTKMNQLEEDLKTKVDITFPQDVARLLRVASYESESGYQETTTKYGWLQGFCLKDNNIIFASVSSYRDNGNAMISELSLDTMTIVRSTTLPLGHANDLEYNPDTNEILCTPSTINGTIVRTLFVIDYETLNIKKTVQLERPASGIAYDPVTKEMAFKDGYSVHYIDSDYKTIRTVQCKQVDNSTGQGMGLHDGLIYMNRSFPESVQVWNQNGEIEKVYELPRVTDEGHFIFETESIKPIGKGQFIIGSTKAKNETLKESVFDFFILDTLNTVKPTPMKESTSSLRRYNNHILNIYVNAGYNKLDSDGSVGKPFKDIQSAINICNNPIYHYNIVVKAGNYGPVYVPFTSSYITIIGETTVASNNIVNGVTVTSAENIYLRNLKINKIPSDTAHIRANDSSVRIDNVVFDGDGDTGISLSDCKLRLSGTNHLTGFRDAIYANNGTRANIPATTVFENCTRSYIYTDNGSLITLDPALQIIRSRIVCVRGGDINDINQDQRKTIDFYNRLGFSLFVGTNGTLEPSSDISINDFTYSGKYYLNDRVTNKPENVNMYLDVTTSDVGHCVQKMYTTSINDYTEYLRKGTFSNGNMNWGEWKTNTYT